jgi:hypothetical protein
MLLLEGKSSVSEKVIVNFQHIIDCLKNKYGSPLDLSLNKNPLENG